MEHEQLTNVLERVSQLKRAIFVLERATKLRHIQEGIQEIPKDIQHDINSNSDIQNITVAELVPILKNALKIEKAKLR